MGKIGHKGGKLDTIKGNSTNYGEIQQKMGRFDRIQDIWQKNKNLTKYGQHTGKLDKIRGIIYYYNFMCGDLACKFPKMLGVL